MVRSGVDAARSLSNRGVMRANGPAAAVGESLEVKFPRPRSRKQLLEDPEYYRLREELIGFLEERSHHRPAPGPGRPPTTGPSTPPAKRTGSAFNRVLHHLTPP